MVCPTSAEDDDNTATGNASLQFNVEKEHVGIILPASRENEDTDDESKGQFTCISQKKKKGGPRVCDGPNGLKRASSSGLDIMKPSKRLCGNSIRDDQNLVTKKMIHDLDPTLTGEEVSAILHDYNHALRILKSRKGSKDESNPSLEYMITLINDWKPKREIICMYVRWSKRLRRNFHLDSISTLLCVAKQCDYTPYVFLKSIKTLTILRSNTTYGLNFKFGTSNSIAAKGKKLNEKFLGLSITLRLLQRTVVTSSGTFGSIGLQTSTKRKGNNDDIYFSTDTNNSEKHIVSNKPTSRFHTTGGLLCRIWLAIQHRWIALQVVEMLFPSQLAQAKTEQESLAFTFQMHSSAGPTRFDFLDPLIGVCFRYHTTFIIDNHTSILQTVWSDPTSFVSFGNRLLQSTMENDRIRCIVETFNSLQSMIQKWKNKTIHQKTDRESKWQMIRGYAFHFWLDRVKNQDIKTTVDRLCRKKSGSSNNKIRELTRRPTSQEDQTLIPTPASKPPALSKETVAVSTGTSVMDESTGYPEGKTVDGGLLSLLTTRQKRLHKTPPTSQLETQEKQQCSHRRVPELLSLNRSNVHMSFEWTSIRLATQSEITSRVSSHLLIHRDDGVTVIEELAPLEVYSADMLYKLRHSRQTSEQGRFPKSEVGSVYLSIGAEVPKFIDPSSRSFHVAREESSYFKEHGNLLPSMPKITTLCKAVLRYGKHDQTRSAQQFRVNIGCGGQHRPDGKPETLIGLQFQKTMVRDPDFNDEEVISTIGKLTEFTWSILKDMQVDANDVTLAPDKARQRQYASHLTKYLGTSGDVGFEDVTIVVGVLYPLMPSVAEHVDCMNDSVAGYTRTGALNVVLSMGHDEDVILLHLQVICNFRRVIREYLLPFQYLLSSIVVHCNQYLAKWQRYINQLYGGKTQHLPSPFDRSNFFLDDCLPFQTVVISNGTQDEQVITGEYLLMEISPSRVLSFSMFIDPIVDLKGNLCIDQQIELCLVASVLSNPFWFEFTLTSLTRKHFDCSNQFRFGMHPLLDWAKETISLFGAWQGGPYNRWSPCGGSTPFPNLFGAHTGASEEERKLGQSRLEMVIEVLYHHLVWVDNLAGSVSDVTTDLPLTTVEGHMSSVTEAIFKIVPCQFSVFRLMVFTTIAAGCGVIKPGVHLRALMYPVKGSASFKHLMNPNKDRMSRTHALALCRQQVPVTNIYHKDQEGVDSQCHDQVMLYLSRELGMSSYLRDETECILCESHPNRNLQCRDWFKKGRRIYDLDADGNVLQREYGIDTVWTKMESPATVQLHLRKETEVDKGHNDKSNDTKR